VELRLALLLGAKIVLGTKLVKSAAAIASKEEA
jgi:hypothetical protein